MTGSADPFLPLTGKAVARSLLDGVGRAVLRPLRPGRSGRGRGGPPNLLLIGVDTLRWDHLSLAGYPHPTSPELDRLGAGGTVFTDVTAAAPWTLPSFASALCGLPPCRHGAFLGGPLRNMDTQPPRPLAPQVRTLARHLQECGYATAAFYANPFFGFGLAETFQTRVYRNHPAPAMIAMALEWIRLRADRPFFCFVLLNDPHEPTTPPGRDLAPFLAAVPHGRSVPPRALRELARWGGGRTALLGRGPWPPDEATARALALKTAVYDGTIRLVDRTLGALPRRLERWGLRENTVVSVFSDHGEEFLDHAGWARRWDHDPRAVRGVGHGHSHFQEILHVPWLAWGPGVPAGARRTEPVSLLDLAPTVLAWLGLPPLPLPPAPAGLPASVAQALAGRSLAAEPPAGGGGAQPERWILAEAIAYGPDLVSMRRGNWKLIAHRDGRPLALLDLDEDPQESLDAGPRAPAVLQDLLQGLRAWRDAAPPHAEAAGGPGAGGSAGPSWQDMDETVRRRLRDLGYAE